jgi:hypothetical protein
MSDKDDGGPAFPCTGEGLGTEFASDGMTLRDYFAAKALQGVAAYDNGDDWDDDRIASWCYEQADAMLRARKS